MDAKSRICAPDVENINAATAYKQAIIRRPITLLQITVGE